jgi:hypothetical protein
MGKEWHYARDGKQSGPLSSTELKQLAASGKLKSDDLIWKEGMDNWVEARSVKGLFPSATAPFSAMMPPQPVQGPSPPPGWMEESPADQGGFEEIHAPPEDSLVQPVSKSRVGTFGHAFGQTFYNMRRALGLLWKHPFRLTLLAIIFTLTSWLALASVVGAVLFPVFVMGYITCIQATVNGEKMGLEGFISFMRHGWDSLWHMLMMLAAFFVTMAAMLAPFLIVGLLLYAGLGSLTAVVGEVGSHSSSTAASEGGQGTAMSPRQPQPSRLPGWMADLLAKAVRFGAMLIVFIIQIVIITPIAAAMIVYSYLVLKVSQGNPGLANRFELVFNAFRDMLAIAQTRWKELLLSGFSVSICYLGIGGVAAALQALLSAVDLYVLAAWVVVGLLPLAMCLFIVYSSVFVTMTCLSLEEEKTSP